jgi:hypothetical protein
VFEANPNAYFTTYSEHIIAAKSDTPQYNLELTAMATANAGSLQVRVITADTIPNDLVMGYAAICQDSIPGILLPDSFNYVCLQLYSFPIDLVYPDTLDTTIVFNHAIPVDRMWAVVFVQNMDTKKVMQAITKQFEEE